MTFIFTRRTCDIHSDKFGGLNMSDRFLRKVSASGLREAPVIGVQGKMEVALAHAFTAGLFHRLQHERHLDRIALRNSRGRPQVIFAQGMWQVVGPTWGQYNVPRRILWWASHSLCEQIKKEQMRIAQRGRVRFVEVALEPESLFDQVTEAIHLSFHETIAFAELS